MATAAQSLDMDTDGFGRIVAAKAVAQHIAEPEVDRVRMREVAETGANVIDAAASVMAAADLMWHSGADCLMVMEGSRFVGMITDRDLIVGCVCHHRRPTRTSVRDIMSAIPGSSAGQCAAKEPWNSGGALGHRR